MATNQLVLSFGLPGLNEIIKAAKRHYMAYATMKKKYDRKVLHEILIQVDPLPSYDSIKLDIVWIESPKKRDPDGIFAGSKFICDSLVKSSIIKNDTRDEIKSISNRIEISDNRKVIINIIGS